MKVDQRAEWEQILDESWRVMKYRFYDEKMHGRDWDAIKAKYEPLLKYVGENQDVYDLANEMIGELNASHTGVSGPPSREIADAYQTRHPGFELEPANGHYRVSHIYRDGPADKEWLDLKVGDYVPRHRRRADQGRRQLLEPLNSPLNEYVTDQRRRRAASPGWRSQAASASCGSRRCRPHRREVRGVGREEPRDRRQGDERTDRLRPHPLDEPAVAAPFQNEINQFSNKKGIIVDIRFNGGGNIDQELIDILERRPYEYWNNRWGSRTGAAGRARRSPGRR